MNRAEKRRIQRSGQKVEQNLTNSYEKNKIWFDKLPSDKRIFIENYVEHMLNVGNELFMDIFNKCVISSLDDNLDINISESKKIIDTSSRYVVDYKKYIENKGNEGLNMIENIQLRNEIKNRIQEYRANKVDRASGLKKLRNEFDIPFAELSDLWIECKSEKIPKKKIISGVSNPSNLEPKPIDTTSNDNLKIINVLKEVQGRHGTYIRSLDCVMINGVEYKDVDTVKKECKAQMDIMNKQIERLKDELKNLEHNTSVERDRYDELLMVFNL